MNYNEALNKNTVGTGTGEEFKNKAMLVENKLEKMSKDAGRKISDMTSELANTTSNYVKSGREYVAKNPVKGLAIALATGAVVGSLITWGMQSRRHD